MLKPANRLRVAGEQPQPRPSGRCRRTQCAPGSLARSPAGFSLFPTQNQIGYHSCDSREGLHVDEAIDVDRLIDMLIEREGGYVDHAADKGGPTCFGITEAVARAQGYRGPMRQLPRDEAAAIYRRLYWLRPRLDEI